MEKNPFENAFLMGVEGDTYQKLLEIAKKEGKSVNDVASEALRKHIDFSKTVSESRERKVLCD
jgi:predicted HicB family RNase H-like nuclease